MPARKRITPPMSPSISGHAKLRFKLSAEVFRHASSGPTPVRKRRKRPSGILTLLKNGAPTLIFEPETASDKTGNSVPARTATHETSKIKLLKRKPTNQWPILDCANACTELTTPLRVRNVPVMHSRNVENTSHTFHTFIMPRFSCIITECKNAVPVSQGSSEAFSTGSQPQ